MVLKDQSSLLNSRRCLISISKAFFYADGKKTLLFPIELSPAFPTFFPTLWVRPDLLKRSEVLYMEYSVSHMATLANQVLCCVLKVFLLQFNFHCLLDFFLNIFLNSKANNQNFNFRQIFTQLLRN